MPPAKLQLDSNGWVNGIPHHNSPNQHSGMAVPSGVMGVVMHTMVGDLPGCDGWFMNPQAQASAHFGIGQDGSCIQWVNVRGGVAWHCANGNPNWYGIEHADHGNPANPLTSQQLDRSAQLLELLSRESVGNFPMQISNSVNTTGYGKHNMGGASWGGHSCPCPSGTSCKRADQRNDIIRIANEIRSGTTSPPQPSDEGESEPMLMARGANAITPLAWLPNVHRFAFFSDVAATVKIDWRPDGIGVGDTTINIDGSKSVFVNIPDGQVKAARLIRVDNGDNDVCVVSGA